MHTCGEPTRIIIDGYPNITGTLLEQRAKAEAQHDYIRKRVILEPRGHYDMYGAVLRPNTEMTGSGQAHMGVLFMTNDGYSTMCGHATIALSRLLIDTHDLNVFPRRDDIRWNPQTLVADVNIHAPCGLLKVKVPVNQDGTASDPKRPVQFLSVPSFATALQIPVRISTPWPRLEQYRDHLDPEMKVEVNIAYGGAFYAIVKAWSLGFGKELQNVDVEELSAAVTNLLSEIRKDEELEQYYQHPEAEDLSGLYGVIVTSTILRDKKSLPDAELGVCFFADGQIDRSPTGSGVAARAALAYYKGECEIGDRWVYHSLISVRDLGPPFIGIVHREVTSIANAITSGDAKVIVQVDGQAYYTGFSTFCVEPEDPLDDGGFVMKRLSTQQYIR